MCCILFFYYSVFWRTSTWVSQCTSVSKRWDLMVSVQTLFTPCTGLQSEHTTTDSQCPDDSKHNAGKGQQVSIFSVETFSASGQSLKLFVSLCLFMYRYVCVLPTQSTVEYFHFVIYVLFRYVCETVFVLWCKTNIWCIRVKSNLI